MFKLLAISLFPILLLAQSLHYEVKAPLFGTIGVVNINYSNAADNYAINASVKTKGFAKALSGNRVESYHANGTIQNGKYLAKHFLQDVHYKKKHIKLEYIFDYPTKKIRKIKKKWKNNHLLSTTDRYLSYFATDDLFSAYHNIVRKFHGGNNPGIYEIKAAGLEAFNGRLEIHIPSKKQQHKEAKILGVRGVWIFHIITHKNLLGSKNGEIIFAVGDDGIAKAVRVLNTSYVSHIDAFLVD